MARPKSTAPLKRHMNLSVTEETRLQLNFVAAHSQQSISALIAEWAEKAAKKTAKETGRKVPESMGEEQLTLFDR